MAATLPLVTPTEAPGRGMSTQGEPERPPAPLASDMSGPTQNGGASAHLMTNVTGVGPSCGAPAADRRFCGSCGTPLVDPEPARGVELPRRRVRRVSERRSAAAKPSSSSARSRWPTSVRCRSARGAARAGRGRAALPCVAGACRAGGGSRPSPRRPRRSRMGSGGPGRGVRRR